MKIGLLGAGGQAREVTLYLQELGGSVLFKAVDEQYIADNDSVDILKPNKKQCQTAVVAAVGAPLLRKFMVEKWAGNSYANIISPRAWVAPDADIGAGSIVAPGVVVTSGVTIGNHTILNPSSTIAHDCSLGEYITVGPGANIAGNVSLGNGAFIGIGATVLNGITIAEGVVVGAGAVVTRDVTEENAVLVGVPAKFIRQNDSWLHEV